MVPSPTELRIWLRQRSSQFQSGSFSWTQRGEQEAGIVRFLWLSALLLRGCESRVDLWLQSPSSRHRTEMERVRACSEAKRLSESPTPAEALLVSQAGRSSCHRVKPPTLLGLEP